VGSLHHKVIMKTNPFYTLLVAVFVFVSSAHGQGAFQNLDFESAQIVPDPFHPIVAADALPGWTVYYGTNQQTLIRAFP
jgi:hypothetical protein